MSALTGEVVEGSLGAKYAELKSIQLKFYGLLGKQKFSEAKKVLGEIKALLEIKVLLVFIV